MAGQPDLKPGPGDTGEGSTPSPSAIYAEAERAALLAIWAEIFDGLKAEGLDISFYESWDTIKLVQAARRGDKPGVILLLGMIEGQTQKLKAEVRRLEAEVAESKIKDPEQ